MLIKPYTSRYILTNYLDMSIRSDCNNNATTNVDVKQQVDVLVYCENFLLHTPKYTEDGQFRLLTPMIAQRDGLSYVREVYGDVVTRENSTGKEIHRQKHVHIGDLPIRVKCDICVLSGLGREGLIACGEDPEDAGGYFIVSGAKTLDVDMPSMDKLVNNYLNKLQPNRLGK